MRGLVTMVQRLLAIVGKELIEVIRRPGALVSLVFGPFIIMALFGAGYGGFRRPLETVVVVPPGSSIPTDAASYQKLAGTGLHIAAVVQDAATAEAGLAAGTTDVIVITPADPAASFKAGQQSVIEVVVDTIDPIRADYANYLASNLSSAVNQAIITRAVEEGQGVALANGQTAAAKIPPEVVAAPTKASLRNAAPTEPRVLAYYGPAVLALILQHLAITLIALALVRERTSGVIELFRVAPIKAGEVIVGKVLAYLLIGGLIAALTITLLIVGFGIPLLGDPVSLAAAIALLLLASLGIGLVVAVISDSERQAVQLSLLLLLASVFFSGFVVAISEFAEPIRILAYALPVTHGIRLIQDIMLRGSTTQLWEYGALMLIAGVTLTAAWLGLRRGMARA
jgi:ABC-2 type transport system permease protein